MSIVAFTTKFVIEDRRLITCVVHDEDGCWQFFSNDESEENDAQIVGLDEIIELDPSIKDILWLRERMEAIREDAGLEWKTSVYKL